MGTEGTRRAGEEQFWALEVKQEFRQQRTDEREAGALNSGACDGWPVLCCSNRTIWSKGSHADRSWCPQECSSAGPETGPHVLGGTPGPQTWGTMLEEGALHAAAVWT